MDASGKNEENVGEAEGERQAVERDRRTGRGGRRLESLM